MMKPIKDFEGYYITEDGRVWSTTSNKYLSPRTDGRGYLAVRLYNDGKAVEQKIHRLVADAFIPNPYGYTEVNHLDENKQNNNAANLEWCSHKDNCNYGTRTLRQSKKISKRVQQLDLSGKLIKEWDSLSQVSKTLNTSINSIWQCCNGISKQSNGYIWRYVKQ